MSEQQPPTRAERGRVHPPQEGAQFEGLDAAAVATAIRKAGASGALVARKSAAADLQELAALSDRYNAALDRLIAAAGLTAETWGAQTPEQVEALQWDARTADAFQAMTRAWEELIRHPLTARPGVRARPAAFAPAAISVLSDPHTQASVRSMWAPGEWQRPPDGQAYYRDSNGVMVYAGPDAAADLVLGLDEDKSSAFLICLGKWFADTNGNLAWPEAARIHVEDILAIRGIKKHHKGGYRLEQKEQVKRDVLFLRDLWVRSNQQVWETTKRGKRQLVDRVVNDPLLEVSFEEDVDLWGTTTPAVFRVRPGPWAQHYLGGPQHWTTAVLKQIMGYDPRQGVGRLKMRLGIYLAFQWRIRATRGTWGQPWKLKTLLEGAKIQVPKKDPQRFFPQVLAALDGLRTDGVLAVCEALDFPDWRPPGDEPPKRWVPKLLEGRWRLMPADEIRGRLPRPPGAVGPS